MLRLLLIFLLLAGSLRAPELDAVFTRRIVRFEIAWDTFIRRYFGCPEGILLTDPEQCSSIRRRLDVGAFSRAQARAKELFQEEKP